MRTHEDSRRRLAEFCDGPYGACKVIVAKEACVLGDHWHAHKTEEFMLIAGRATRVIIGNREFGSIDAPYAWTVPPGTYHLFDLEPGSVLIGTATKPFDPEDEIKGRPDG